MVSLNSMIKAAKKSRHHSHKHSAMVFKGGAVISVANNTEHRHAEVAALGKVAHYKDMILLSVRVGKNGELRMARPCGDCLAYIKSRGIRTILFSDEQGQIVKEKI